MHVQNKKYGHFVFISRLTGLYATQKLKKTFAVIVYGHVLYIIIMIILRSQNKNTDFLMILD